MDDDESEYRLRLSGCKDVVGDVDDAHAGCRCFDSPAATVIGDDEIMLGALVDAGDGDTSGVVSELVALAEDLEYRFLGVESGVRSPLTIFDRDLCSPRLVGVDGYCTLRFRSCFTFPSAVFVISDDEDDEDDDAGGGQGES